MLKVRCRRTNRISTSTHTTRTRLANRRSEFVLQKYRPIRHYSHTRPSALSRCELAHCWAKVAAVSKRTTISDIGRTVQLKMLAVKQVRFNSFKSVLLADHKSMPFYLFVFLLLSGLLGKCLVQAQTDSSTGDDSKGDGEEIPPPPKQLTCDFGSGQELNSCNFDFLNATSHPNIRWKLGTGQTAFWLGGPLKDRTTMENTGKSL